MILIALRTFAFRKPLPGRIEFELVEAYLKSAFKQFLQPIELAGFHLTKDNNYH